MARFSSRTGGRGRLAGLPRFAEASTEPSRRPRGAAMLQTPLADVADAVTVHICEWLCGPRVSRPGRPKLSRQWGERNETGQKNDELKQSSPHRGLCLMNGPASGIALLSHLGHFLRAAARLHR